MRLYPLYMYHSKPNDNSLPIINQLLYEVLLLYLCVPKEGLHLYDQSDPKQQFCCGVVLARLTVQ